MKIKGSKAVEFLLARGNLPILYWLKKEILEVPADRERKNLKKFAERIRLLEDQLPHGGWEVKNFKNQEDRWAKTRSIIETLRNLLWLYLYGCTYEDQGVKKAIEFLFSTQTEEGDFRGAYLNEYATTYHCLILEVLELYGLDRDQRTQKGFQWLMQNRQNDGGWAIPYRTVGKEELKNRYSNPHSKNLPPLSPDKTKPSSHLVTGMALRALSISPTWKSKSETLEAARWLTTRFFQEDYYEDRREASYWEEISYPYWATNILSSLDTLARLGFLPEEAPIRIAIEWLAKQQNKHGYWLSAVKKAGIQDHLWATFAVLKVLKMFKLLEV
ncbi:MAG: hypothetical protein B5M54_03225 [Candidatus Aminicenantes bacterium 4484_214]|nr:MAG: hypothetical protein B5M54_03225 [Candidatus Aminicenantes bacterium 4484_214]RLE07461.1 MAG: hypothetical protein DRJ06_05885 [Candidatus Aminicenantes bacterium]